MAHCETKKGMALGLAMAMLAGTLACSAGTPVAPPVAARAAPARTVAARPVGATKAAPAATAVLVDPDVTFDGTFERGDARALHLDESVLAEIVDEAERTRSDSLLVLRDGKVVVERYFGKPRGPIEIMSVTKSVVSIAIGMLIAEGKIRSIDEPLSTWFADWRSGRKAAVTLKHVLTQTSGLEHRAGANVLSQQADRLKFARASAIVEEPGKRFSYNNEATELLAGVVMAAAGKPLDAYVAERLFAPLEIRDWSWAKDRANNVQAYYGLALSARDLAKVGTLMLAGGTWRGARVLSPEWVTASTTEQVPASGYGYLWWIRRGQGQLVTTADRLAELEGRGFRAASKLRPLIDRPPVWSAEAYWMEVG